MAAEGTSHRIDGGDTRAMGPAARSTPQLLRDIASDTSTLVRQEIQLARQEVMEGVAARVKAAVAMAVAGVLGLFALGFLGATAAAALDNVVSPWLSRLIVAAGFGLIALVAAAFGMLRMKRPSLAPEETKRTVKENVEWARAQLKR
jgi:putative superfamily III holin-X